ncbi:MAG: hypothetical protein ACRDOY_02915 [Nocardioidaceae bacterium]
MLTVDDLVAQLADDSRAAIGSLRQLIPDVDIMRGARYLGKDSRAAAFVEKNGQAGLKALLDANGELAAAGAILATSTAPTPGAKPEPKPDPKVAPAAGAAVAGAGATPKIEESDKPGPPLRWDPTVNGVRAVASGGMVGALDFNWRRDSSGATVYRQRFDVDGRTYDFDATYGVDWHAHHSWPQNLGGRAAQPLMTVRNALHLSVIHPALHAYLIGQDHSVTQHTTDPRNVTFIARLQAQRTYRHEVYDDLMAFYALVNRMTSPQMPTNAYQLGVDDALADLGG